MSAGVDVAAALAEIDKALALARDLRTAAALARDWDFRRLASLFAEHPWPGLAALGCAARDALQSFSPHQIHPAALTRICDSRDAELVAEMLAAFGAPA